MESRDGAAAFAQVQLPDNWGVLNVYSEQEGVDQEEEDGSAQDGPREFRYILRLPEGEEDGDYEDDEDEDTGSSTTSTTLYTLDDEEYEDASNMDLSKYECIETTIVEMGENNGEDTMDKYKLLAEAFKYQTDFIEALRATESVPTDSHQGGTNQEQTSESSSTTTNNTETPKS